MQRITNTTTIFALVLLIQLSNFAQITNNRWQFVGVNSVGSGVFLEKDVERLAGSRRRTWTKEIFRDGSYKIARAEWQCRTKKYGILEANDYAPEGNFVSREGSTDWLTVVPDSVSETYFRKICSGDERSHGAWYQVIVPDSEKIGWLRGDQMKIIGKVLNRQRSRGKIKPFGESRERESN